ncbi:uncharacterized protein EI97DRAFT_286063 [Westerdykella ornata]|uniref:BZIP domain-containing protein n=1 Tax=Westerdykella ornata TaxID=318751 RepID=A0A6A6J5D7_WESOR|nr:uncharacterized protein EI97DRAFT_286063 [Westerdykella ornata]KAF2271353.1 hypothetical protein EI97DRAFT_286063 [Westerdykella ornata]
MQRTMVPVCLQNSRDKIKMRDSCSRATKEQNLARIRENQRRSRARRKEYVQELEAKIRHHEKMGIGASAEIQSAARRVLEENRRLRAMLRTRGVPEREIAAALDQTSAAPVLQSMLDRRRTLPMTPTEPADDSPTPEFQPQRAELSPPAMVPQPTLPLTIPEDLTPNSPLTSVDTPISEAETPYLPIETTQAVDIKTEAALDYNPPTDQYSSDNWGFPSQHLYTFEPIPFSYSSSCISAANIIRTVHGDCGPELEMDLGCRAAGQDCRVANSLIFNVMEKYSNQPIRM